MLKKSNNVWSANPPPTRPTKSTKTSKRVLCQFHSPNRFPFSHLLASIMATSSSCSRLYSLDPETKRQLNARFAAAAATSSSSSPNKLISPLPEILLIVESLHKKTSMAQRLECMVGEHSLTRLQALASFPPFHPASYAARLLEQP
jgi:hypothetical protein